MRIRILPRISLYMRTKVIPVLYICLQYEHPSFYSFQRQEEDKKEKERRQKEQLRLNNAQTRGEAKKKVN
jgi:hypothetical protein